MASPFLKTFDEILSLVLTDYNNLASAPDTSQGSSAFIMGSVVSSAVWSLYKYQDYISRQRFISTADTENLDKWGSLYNIPRTASETNPTYAARILDYIRNPSAGGNAADFKAWALDKTNSHFVDGSDVDWWNGWALVVSQANGIGTVGIYTIPLDQSIVNNGANTTEEDLRLATETYIESVRPSGMVGTTVYSADPVSQNITVNVSAPVGGTIDTNAMMVWIDYMVAQKGPGESLYHSDITFVCYNYGAAYAKVTLPVAFESTVDNDEYYRAGNVIVTEV